MEVHHHPGDRHGPKKFKDYFLEFLMIFLAVTMGFLAENIREYINDRNHVKELVGQLKEDLINDTINIQALINIEKSQISKGDSLFDMLSLASIKIDYVRLQELIKASDHIDLFYPSTGAMSTIKMELHLKEFVKTKIASHIDNYEKLIAVLKEFENRDINYMGKYLESFMSSHFTPENAVAAVEQKPFVNGNLRNITDQELVQLSVDVTLIKAYNQLLIRRYLLIKTNAANFIKHLNTTYNLDD